MPGAEEMAGMSEEAARLSKTKSVKHQYNKTHNYETKRNIQI